MRSEDFLFALATYIGKSAAFILRHYVGIVTTTSAASMIVFFSWAYSFLLSPPVAFSAGALTTLLLCVGGLVWYGLKQELFKETNWDDDDADQETHRHQRD